MSRFFAYGSSDSESSEGEDEQPILPKPAPLAARLVMAFCSKNVKIARIVSLFSVQFRLEVSRGLKSLNVTTLTVILELKNHFICLGSAHMFTSNIIIA